MNGTTGSRATMTEGLTTCSFCRNTMFLDLKKNGDTLNRKRLAQSLVDHRSLRLEVPDNLTELELPLCNLCKNLSMEFSSLWKQLGGTYRRIVDRIAVGELKKQGRHPNNYHNLEERKWEGLKDVLWKGYTTVKPNSQGAAASDDYESDSSVEEDSVAMLMEEEEDFAPKISNVRSIRSSKKEAEDGEDVFVIPVPIKVEDEQVKQVLADVQAVHLSKRPWALSSIEIGSKKPRGRPKNRFPVNNMTFGRKKTSSYSGQVAGGSKRLRKCKDCGGVFFSAVSLMKHRFKCTSTNG